MKHKVTYTLADVPKCPSATLIHVFFLFFKLFSSFPFLFCCVRWDVTCRNRKAFLCEYSPLQGYQVRIKPCPFFSAQTQQNSSSCVALQTTNWRFLSTCSLHAFCFTQICYPDLPGHLALCFTVMFWTPGQRSDKESCQKINMLWGTSNVT